uniref:Uncharacterized protein n=2 Tax=Oryza sativa subsp. japonica TaxID=39947 RepID=Q2R597_ORYSJ|nr:hypothetical protein LOC_Os11g25760 [Oryza sativa Japonica Group]AAX96282.1 hypothetical protein [Oryza sativa Japonica Group]ABA93385.1 hypothetical protein LOC_Os11g25760 [Oryza sativa Japonica Group]
MVRKHKCDWFGLPRSSNVLAQVCIICDVNAMQGRSNLHYAPAQAFRRRASAPLQKVQMNLNHKSTIARRPIGWEPAGLPELSWFAWWPAGSSGLFGLLAGPFLSSPTAPVGRPGRDKGRKGWMGLLT